MYSIAIDRECEAQLRFGKTPYCTWLVSTPGAKFDLTLGGYPVIVKEGDKGFVDTTDDSAVVSFNPT
jgi:hypothetical protein